MIATAKQRAEFALKHRPIAAILPEPTKPCRECARRGGVPERFVGTHFTRHEDGKCITCEKNQKNT